MTTKKTMTPSRVVPTQIAAKLTPVTLSGYAEQAMKKYGSYVVMDRAVADARDGCKPVQRRTIWSMWNLGLSSNKAPKKSAAVVGDVIGNYNPHGDTSAYDALVNMTHHRYPLVEGHGNFGSDLSPTAAAYRYTETRLSPFGEANMEEIHVMGMLPNFCGDKKEPIVLPARVPLLLANGSEGIAVGVSACIPPHNLGELIDATTALVHNPNLSTQALLKRVHGPDYGSARGVMLSSPDEVLAVYATGRGSLSFRAEYELSKDNKGRNIFILRSLAPGLKLEAFKEKMNKLQKDGLIEDNDDESSDENGIRVVVTCKDMRVLEQRVLPAAHTRESYQFYTVRKEGETDVLDEKTLRFCTFKELLLEFIDFRRAIETKRITHLLEVARRALKRAKALHTAVSKLDLVFAVLKKQGLADDAALRKAMGKALGLDEEGAEFVLEMKTRQLAKLNLGDLTKNMEKFREEIEVHKKDLKAIDDVVIRRLNEMRKFGDKRGMKVRVDGAAVAGKAKPSLVAAKRTGAVTLCGDALPTDARSSYDYVVKTGERALLVTEENRGVNFFTAYAAEAKLKRIVGMAKDTDIAVAAIDESGKGLVFKGDIRTQKFDVLKAPKGNLVSATGLGAKDMLLVHNADGEGQVLNPEKVTRHHVLSYPISDVKHATKVLRVPTDAVLLNGFKPIALKKDGSFTLTDAELPVWVVTTTNYAHIGKEKGVYTKEQVLAAVKKGLVSHVVPIV